MLGQTWRKLGLLEVGQIWRKSRSLRCKSKTPILYFRQVCPKTKCHWFPSVYPTSKCPRYHSKLFLLQIESIFVSHDRLNGHPGRLKLGDLVEISRWDTENFDRNLGRLELCVWERERERETERHKQTDRQRERQNKIQKATTPKKNNKNQKIQEQKQKLNRNDI